MLSLGCICRTAHIGRREISSIERSFEGVWRYLSENGHEQVTSCLFCFMPIRYYLTNIIINLKHKKMKKVFFIGAMMLCGMLIFSNNVEAQSKRDINKAKKEEWKREQERKRQADEQQRKIDSIKRAQELEALQAKPAEVFQVEIPCYAESRSDKEFFRELGEGQDLQRNVARLAAVKMAQSMMRERLAHSVKGLSTDYSKLMNKSGKSSDLEQLMQGEFMNVVDGVLKDADVCETDTWRRAGVLRCGVAGDFQRR